MDQKPKRIYNKSKVVPPESAYVTKAEALGILKVGRSTFQKKQTEGFIAPTYKQHNRNYYSRADVVAMKNQTIIWYQ